MTNLKAYLEQEKNQIKANLQSEQKYWEQVKNDCGKQDSNYRNKLKKEEEKLAGEQNKAQQERAKKIEEMCTRKVVYDLVPSCNNISALSEAMFATGREFLVTQQNTNLRRKIEQTCGSKIENFDSSSFAGNNGSGGGVQFGENKKQEGPSEEMRLDLTKQFKGCKGELPIDKLMSTLNGPISKLANTLGVDASKVAGAIKEGHFANIIETLPEVLKNKINAGDVNMKSFEDNYKTKYCKGSDKDRNEANIQFNKLYNSLEFIAKNARKKGTATMGENNNGNVDNLHIPACDGIQANAPRKPDDFNSQINNIMQSAGGIKRQ